MIDSLQVPPLLDAPTLLENIARLPALDLVLFAGCLALAVYFITEGFVSDFAKSEFAVVNGQVVDSNFRFGEDSPGFTVEFRAESGDMHAIDEVRHPWRMLKVGEPVMVRYPKSRPDKARPHYPAVTLIPLKILKIAGALAIAYAVATRGG